jgi:hypothetical protein
VTQIKVTEKWGHEGSLEEFFFFDAENNLNDET